EALRALRLERDATFHVALSRVDLALRRAERNRTHEPRAPVLRRDALQLAQQLAIAVGVRRVLPGVARREHARRSAERIDRQPGIVGEGQQAALLGVGPRLEHGVLLEGVAGLLDLRLNRSEER